MDNPFKALLYTLCEDNLVPWLRYSFSDISLSVCVYDVGCFVDVLASRSRYSGRKPSVLMIAILLSSLGGFVDRVTEWCVTGPGFAPRPCSVVN